MRLVDEARIRVEAGCGAMDASVSGAFMRRQCSCGLPFASFLDALFGFWRSVVKRVDEARIRVEAGCGAMGASVSGAFMCRQCSCGLPFASFLDALFG